MSTTDMSSSPKRPTHRVYAVTGKGEKKTWYEIGAAWPHADGEGFSLKLNLVPAASSDAEIVIRKITPKPGQAEKGGAQ
jgi:hypothetical protein